MALRKITPDREKVSSLLGMVEVSLQRIQETNDQKFTTHVTRDYYEILMELMTAVLCLDGFKTEGEGAHKQLIDYLQTYYKELQDHEIALLDDLRTIRNKIAYDGFFVEPDYLQPRKIEILIIIKKLKSLIHEKLK